MSEKGSITQHSNSHRNNELTQKHLSGQEANKLKLFADSKCARTRIPPTHTCQMCNAHFKQKGAEGGQNFRGSAETNAFKTKKRPTHPLLWCGWLYVKSAHARIHTCMRLSQNKLHNFAMQNTSRIPKGLYPAGIINWFKQVTIQSTAKTPAAFPKDYTRPDSTCVNDRRGLAAFNIWCTQQGKIKEWSKTCTL
jgi:hypothetical protein